MKLVKIETLRLAEHPHALWLHLHTDDGLVGLGETYYVPGAVEAAIHEFAAPLLLGASAFDRERHWQDLFSYINFFGYGGAEMRAISAIDIALWDLIGQHVGQPIHQLIGGRCRESIPIYNTCVDTPAYADQRGFLNEPAELAHSLLSEGITHLKIWPWDRFAPPLSRETSVGPAGRSAVGPAGHYLKKEDLEQGLWSVREIRRAVGDRMAISIEGHSRWDLNCALAIARAVEPYDVAWMEDMIQPNSADDLSRLAAGTRAPQCVSERLLTRYAYRDILSRGAAHIAMIDLIWTGGITEAMKIASLADAHHLAIAPHDCTGPINQVASLHVCAAAPNAMIMEIVRGFVSGYYRELIDRALPIADGKAWFDFGPGLGVRLRPEVMTRTDLRVRTSTL